MIDSVSNNGAASFDRKQRRQRRAASADRLPPHSPEAEQGVLGCALLSPRECLGELVGKFKSRSDVFYDPRHQLIYDAMVQMWDQQKAIDLITIQEELKNKGLLEQIGGIAYIAGLPDTVPSAANLSYYAEIVWEKFLLRKAIQVCTECVGSIYDFEGEVNQLLDKVERDILAINENRAATELAKLPKLMRQAIDLVEGMHRGVGMIGGIRTHFGYFDKMTGGLHKQEMVVIAARPSRGKTSLAMNMAQNIAKREKLPVGVFSMEMSALDLTLRLWCAEAETDFHKIRTGFVSQEAMERLTTSCTKVSQLPIYIDDTPALSILELRAKARRMVHQFGVKVFFVDYLQLMHSTDDHAQNREQEVSDISSGLKSMAKELQVPVVVLSQLNRESEKRKYAKPQLSDLRESGAIEQDADLVGILYGPQRADNSDDPFGPEYYEEGADDARTNLLVAKQRNGPTGDVEFIFKRWCMKFVDAYENRGRKTPPNPMDVQ